MLFCDELRRRQTLSLVRSPPDSLRVARIGQLKKTRAPNKKRTRGDFSPLGPKFTKRSALVFSYIAQESLVLRDGRISITNMGSQDISTVTRSHSAVTKVPDCTNMVNGLTPHL